MSPLAFLIIPLVVVAIGCVWLWARSRRPQTLDSGIDDFQREMRALSPENERYQPRRERGRDADRGQG
jgi:hypothetical protein